MKLMDLNLLKVRYSGEWNKFHNDKRYNSTQIGFSIASVESILKRIEIQFSPTKPQIIIQ